MAKFPLPRDGWPIFAHVNDEVRSKEAPVGTVHPPLPRSYRRVLRQRKNDKEMKRESPKKATAMDERIPNELDMQRKVEPSM
jgi:hypothetical protein